MQTTLRYAGIGSRETPEDIQRWMFDIAQQLAENWVLRSGYADGADMAFFEGAHRVGGRMEMFIPWPGFNKAPNDSRFIVPEITPDLLELARKHHPAWERCSPGAQRLHARNGCQILGLDLWTPVDMVVCWTKGGLGGGGTGQALRIARSYGIPIFDLAIKGKIQELEDFANQLQEA
jgi:hypothetical protein